MVRGSLYLQLERLKVQAEASHAIKNPKPQPTEPAQAVALAAPSLASQSREELGL